MLSSSSSSATHRPTLDTLADDVVCHANRFLTPRSALHFVAASRPIQSALGGAGAVEQARQSLQSHEQSLVRARTEESETVNDRAGFDRVFRDLWRVGDEARIALARPLAETLSRMAGNDLQHAFWRVAFLLGKLRNPSGSRIGGALITMARHIGRMPPATVTSALQRLLWLGRHHDLPPQPMREFLTLVAEALSAPNLPVARQRALFQDVLNLIETRLPGAERPAAAAALRRQIRLMPEDVQDGLGQRLDQIIGPNYRRRPSRYNSGPFSQGG